MSKNVKTALWIVWLAFAAAGVYGLYLRFFVGRELSNYGSYVPWGLWVSAYIYFIGLSAGAFLISSLIYVFGLRSLARLGRLALFTAAITLVMALAIIWLDIGHMWRAYEILTRPNFHSMMAWMVWLYSAYFLLILAELWFEMRCDLAQRAHAGGPGARLSRILSLGWRCPEDAAALAACHRRSRRVLRVLGACGVPLAIAFHGGVGALFATLASRPYWHHALFPILFLTGALVSGGALLLALLALTGDDRDPELATTLRFLGRVVLGLLAFDLILEWSETSIPMWYGVGPDVDLYREILFGQFWYVFWIVHLLLGSVLPMALLLWKPTARWSAATGGLLIAVTFLAVRLNLVIPGQVTPALKNLEHAYVDHRLVFHYVPSFFEWSMIAFIVSLGMAAFLIGWRLLPLSSSSPETV
ncbi:MAG: hypothetical protein D6696_13750 [Acidobacteria bacterium]|nr:MAG: hypothetical protein D6696_13750 [Acidobacteriota bacterium]